MSRDSRTPRRYITFQMVEVAFHEHCFTRFCGLLRITAATTACLSVRLPNRKIVTSHVNPGSSRKA
jgi:hypothetical protein